MNKTIHEIEPPFKFLYEDGESQVLIQIKTAGTYYKIGPTHKQSVPVYHQLLLTFVRAINRHNFLPER